MKTGKAILISNLLFFAVLLLSSCASTVVTSEWVSPAARRTPIGSTLVLGISGTETTRRLFEDTFVGALHRRGVNAVPAYSLLPEAGEMPPERLKGMLRQSGAETAIVTRLVRVDRETRVYPGMGYPYGFYGGYHYAWGGYYDPPIVQEVVQTTLETSLYDSESEGLLWSATTRTVDPAKLEGEVSELVEVLLDRLTENGLIPPARSP